MTQGRRSKGATHDRVSEDRQLRPGLVLLEVTSTGPAAVSTGPWFNTAVALDATRVARPRKHQPLMQGFAVVVPRSA